MPKKTKKYLQALQTAKDCVPSPEIRTQEELYTALNAINYFWDSDKGQWFLASAPNSPGSVIRVRVEAPSDLVEEEADFECRKRSEFYLLTQRSKPYINRPPDQLRSRIYLEFIPKLP